MKDRTRWIVGGAAVGAVAGALVAWYMVRRTPAPKRADGTADAVAPVDRGQMLRLGMAVVNVVREVLNLG